MERIRNSLKFILDNFGPIVVFYVANHFHGIKIAILASVAWTVGEVLFHRFNGKSTSPFFKFSAAITILFGVLDMYLQQSVFFKYEASVSNILFGFYFGSTLLSEKPLILEFARAQGRIRGEITPDSIYFFKFLTAIWTAYFIVKAAFYCWVASRYTLEEGLAIRGVVGNLSFYALLFISIFGAKQIALVLAKLRFLPSTRAKPIPS